VRLKKAFESSGTVMLKFHERSDCGDRLYLSAVDDWTSAK